MRLVVSPLLYELSYQAFEMRAHYNNIPSIAAMAFTRREYRNALRLFKSIHADDDAQSRDATTSITKKNGIRKGCRFGKCPPLGEAIRRFRSRA